MDLGLLVPDLSQEMTHSEFALVNLVLVEVPVLLSLVALINRWAPPKTTATG